MRSRLVSLHMTWHSKNTMLKFKISNDRMAFPHSTVHVMRFFQSKNTFCVNQPKKMYQSMCFNPIPALQLLNCLMVDNTVHMCIQIL